MKFNKTKIAILMGTSLFATIGIAQQPVITVQTPNTVPVQTTVVQPQNGTTTVTTVSPQAPSNVGSVTMPPQNGIYVPGVVDPNAIGASVNVGPGNAYEQQVTPLLRDVSRKKSLLELRKLDRELEKIEEESAKAKQELEEKSKAPTNAVHTPGIGPSGLPFSPQLIPGGMTQPPVAIQPDVSKEVRVLMVYGYDSNLFAKISMGNQGGYVVKEGDILPDGRRVISISPTHIEVTKATQNKKSKSSNLDKIYVSGPAPVNAQGLPIASTATAPVPTANASPMQAPAGLPGMLGTSPTVIRNTGR